LNARVANLPQYTQLKDFSPTIGLGWLQEYKNVVTNANLTLASTMTGHRDEKSSTVRYIAVNADIGYDVIKGDRIMLYPMVGLGLQKYQALFYRDNSTVNFNDVLVSPTLENAISAVKFKNGYAVYRGGIGFAIKAPKYPVAIGIQAGYIGSFKKNQWRTNEDQNLLNSPEDKISQFYVSLILMSKPWMRMGRM
jgi:opacity protein-like surface antigen